MAARSCSITCHIHSRYSHRDPGSTHSSIALATVGLWTEAESEVIDLRYLSSIDTPAFAAAAARGPNMRIGGLAGDVAVRRGPSAGHAAGSASDQRSRVWHRRPVHSVGTGNCPAGHLVRCPVGYWSKRSRQPQRRRPVTEVVREAPKRPLVIPTMRERRGDSTLRPFANSR